MTEQELYDFNNKKQTSNTLVKLHHDTKLDGSGKPKSKSNFPEGALGTSFGEDADKDDSGSASLRFPDNIASFPTYMQYSAYAFIPSTSTTSKASAFGNVIMPKKSLISIYLPSVKSSITEGQGWGLESANNALSAGLAAGNSDSFFGGAGNVISNVKDVGVGTLAKAANEMASVQGVGVVEQQALKYDGPEIRTFTCTYTFVPRSWNESNTINDIIKQFRWHSAPENATVAAGTRTYKFPSLFKIKWLDNSGDENEWLPQFETCYCKSVAVEYGDENLTTFYAQHGAPTTYTLTLNFEELDYPTKQTIAAGR
jgi:hypothetical protein